MLIFRFYNVLVNYIKVMPVDAMLGNALITF